MGTQKPRSPSRLLDLSTLQPSEPLNWRLSHLSIIRRLSYSTSSLPQRRLILRFLASACASPHRALRVPSFMIVPSYPHPDVQLVDVLVNKNHPSSIYTCGSVRLRSRRAFLRTGIVTEIAVAAVTMSSKLPSVRRRAYVTFLAGDGDYWKGVVGLAKGLRNISSAYPLVVAALYDVPQSHRRLLESQGCIVREIEPVYPPANQTRFAMPYYVINYSKLRIWEFVEYERMVYLDADIQVYEDIDHLFDLPLGHFYAVMDCFCEKTWSHTPQYEIGYCQQSPERVAWPVADLGPPPALYFNAGMFVFEPAIATCKSLLATLEETSPTPFAEQDFLNMFFKDVYKPIPLEYNLVLAMLWRHPEKVELEKVKVVHYCAAGSKPWSYTGKEENMDREDIKKLVRRWWEIFSNESLDFKKAAAAAAVAGIESGAVVIANAAATAGGLTRPLMHVMKDAGGVKYAAAPSAA